MTLANFSRKAILCFALTLVNNISVAQVENLTPDQKLPIDPKITIGKLENGLTFYIRENQKPENRAELRLVVNAGSILEDEDQRGLAHFVEHMAFNGTKHFAKQEIIDFLESIGMQFGPDINAYTGFDETVYMLQVPTDSAELVEKGVQILGEWAHNISFDELEIDKERGVVVEEWRTGRGAQARMRDRQFPVILRNSRYAKRLPIGKKKILEEAPYEALRRFYHDWYRPELMAVVAVGDFKKDRIEAIIKKRFSSLKNLPDGRKRESFPVPGHKKTLYTIVSDIEATNTNISIYRKMEVSEQGTARSHRNSLIEALYHNMFNNRLEELMQQTEPPYLAGFSGKVRFVRSKEFYILAAIVKEGGTLTGLENVLTEARRVKKFGFVRSELEREKTAILRSMEQTYNERDKTHSRQFAAEYIRNFLTGEPLPGIEYEFELYKKFIPEIMLNEVNGLASSWLQEDSRVVALSAPKKEKLALPTAKALRDVFVKVEQKQVAAYEDKVPDLPLVEKPPVPGNVVKEKVITELDVTELQLSNGVRVVLKPTDFQTDQILFTSFSPGGHSLIGYENYVPAMTAGMIMRESGVGSFNRIALQKKLVGKLVAVSPFINELEEGISGQSAPRDIETAFELIYLYFTTPRRDTTAFESFQKRMIGFIRNRHANPEAAWSDTIQVTMANYHERARPWSVDLLQEMNLDKSFRIYQDRFADAGDFTFFFVGNFEVARIKTLAAKYLGSLPAINRSENWKDIGMNPPRGVISKNVKKGLEPKSRVSIIFTGRFEWNRGNRYRLRSMARVFQIKLREILREELGGTYGVRVTASGSRYPKSEYSINIGFECAPERLNELVNVVFEQINILKTDGTTEKYLTKVKETQRRRRETNLKENRFWLNALRSSYYYDSDPGNILNYEELVENLDLDDIQNAARTYFDINNYVQVVLLPEDS